MRPQSHATAEPCRTATGHLKGPSVPWQERRDAYWAAQSKQEPDTAKRNPCPALSAPDGPAGLDDASPEPCWPQGEMGLRPQRFRRLLSKFRVLGRQMELAHLLVKNQQSGVVLSGEPEPTQNVIHRFFLFNLLTQKPLEMG